MVEPVVVKVGRYFINLSQLLWAEVNATASDPPRIHLSLIFSRENAINLDLSGQEAERLLQFLAATSHHL